MRLNPNKCSFKVQTGKLLGFMLTGWGIKVNPYKCQVITDMRSQTLMKEMQQLMTRITTLSRFLSCAGDKFIRFFATLKK